MATAKKTAKPPARPAPARTPARPPASGAPQWAAAPPAVPAVAWAPTAAPMAGAPPLQSGMLKAGTILLLVGAILHVIGAFFLVVISAGMIALEGAVEEETGLGFVAVLYLVFGLVLAVGGFFGFSAWRKAKANDLHRAWIHGLVSALLPPLQVVTLLGAIFVLVSPEHEAQERAKQAWGQSR